MVINGATHFLLSLLWEFLRLRCPCKKGIIERVPGPNNIFVLLLLVWIFLGFLVSLDVILGSGVFLRCRLGGV